MFKNRKKPIIGIAKEDIKKSGVGTIIFNSKYYNNPSMEQKYRASGNINAGDIVYLDSQGRIRRSYKAWWESMFEKLGDKIKKVIARVREIRNPKYPHPGIANNLPCFYCHFCEEILLDITEVVELEDVTHCWQCGSKQLEYFDKEDI